MKPNIIDRFVKVVKVHYMNHTVSATYQYCIKVEVEFLHPRMYVNGWDTCHIPIHDNIGVLTDSAYDYLFGLYKYCGVSREDLLLWVVSHIDFDKACDKNLYLRLRQNFVFDD